MKDEKNLTFHPKQPGTKKGYTGGSCKTLENKGKSSFRATPAKAGGDPESRISKRFWIPAFVGAPIKTDGM